MKIRIWVCGLLLCVGLTALISLPATALTDPRDIGLTVLENYEWGREGDSLHMSRAWFDAGTVTLSDAACGNGTRSVKLFDTARRTWGCAYLWLDEGCFAGKQGLIFYAKYADDTAGDTNSLRVNVSGDGIYYKTRDSGSGIAYQILPAGATDWETRTNEYGEFRLPDDFEGYIKIGFEQYEWNGSGTAIPIGEKLASLKQIDVWMASYGGADEAAFYIDDICTYDEYYGKKITGWHTDPETGLAYYFDANGVLNTEPRITVDGVICNFYPAGSVVDGVDVSYSYLLGWKKMPNKITRYYAEGEYFFKTGFQPVGDKRYFFNKTSGALYIPSAGVGGMGWYKSGGAYYALSPETGEWIVGLYTDANGNTYYYKKYDTKAGYTTGLAEVDGETYYFSPDNGRMVRSRTIDFGDHQLTFGADGKMTKAVGIYNGYCYDENGDLYAGGILFEAGGDLYRTTTGGKLDSNYWYRTDPRDAARSIYLYKGKVLEGMVTIDYSAWTYNNKMEITGSGTYYFAGNTLTPSTGFITAENGLEYYFSTATAKRYETADYIYTSRVFYNFYAKGTTVDGVDMSYAHKTGLVRENGILHYYEDGVRGYLTDTTRTVDGIRYMIAADGMAVADPGTLTVNVSDSLHTSANLSQLGGLPTELPTQVLTVGGTDLALFPSNHTVAARVLPGMSVMQSGSLSLTDTVLVSRANVMASNGALLPPERVSAAGYWRRNYWGLFSFYRQSGKVVGFFHGENKNEIWDGNRYTNTVVPPRDYRDTDYSGLLPSGEYNDAWGYYFGFLSMAVCPEDELTQTDAFLAHDAGPVIWPDGGYLDAQGDPVGNGLRHPCVFADGGYVYVYYLDTATCSIRLARAAQNADGTPGEFYKYADGGFRVRALPDGFDKNDPAFLYKGTGRSQPLFSQYNPVCFRVARIKGTALYLGVVEDIAADGSCGLYLRLSSDLVHWSEPVAIPGTRGSTWGTSQMHYPLFTDDRCRAVDEVDPEGFNLVGMVLQDNYSVPQYLRLSVTLK